MSRPRHRALDPWQIVPPRFHALSQPRDCSTHTQGFSSSFAENILVSGQRSADAAIDAAKAAQENLRLLKESYEERIGQGRQVVHEAIQRAKKLIVYWKTQAAHIAQPPHGNPDPAPLANSGLLDILSHARQISPECASLLIEANQALMNAKSELEKAYAAARKQTFTATPGRAREYLEQAEGLLDTALPK